uniref:ADP-ribosylation factor n=1 Tax=Paramoeba aestuarina TaxID=180227 RepID=A0A7S4NVJ4_9EUKA|eukprot:CAMPEP_0201529852 /NCGR_PEP_ID=MMETSP0161_2-20130828/43021_1 /ASSEMBLY_ACC=CAM_ASM_000251 /TAXON_ID=180227 /ORGANISM="Neoparamoeba aestuarina, Strain SoJaBio B1-5/56/2" /LENGTH=182 /DNA_ID=CAMNT_0047931887 /DNA_START=47 /DNA_END=595 /DNA_ORIENTATION=+
MGGVYSYFFPPTPVRIILLGLRSGGKTTILYQFKLNEVVSNIPTIGFNVELIEYKNYALTMWDMGACDKLRPMWKHHFKGTDAVIFVVDSSVPRKDIEEARDEMEDVLATENLENVKVLIMANKQDLPNALSVEDITEELHLNRPGGCMKDRTWNVIGTNAIIGEGIYEGLDWILTVVQKDI